MSEHAGHCITIHCQRVSVPINSLGACMPTWRESQRYAKHKHQLSVASPRTLSQMDNVPCPVWASLIAWRCALDATSHGTAPQRAACLTAPQTRPPEGSRPPVQRGATPQAGGDHAVPDPTIPAKYGDEMAKIGQFRSNSWGWVAEPCDSAASGSETLTVRRRYSPRGARPSGPTALPICPITRVTLWCHRPAASGVLQTMFPVQATCNRRGHCAAPIVLTSCCMRKGLPQRILVPLRNPVHLQEAFPVCPFLYDLAANAYVQDSDRVSSTMVPPSPTATMCVASA